MDYKKQLKGIMVKTKGGTSVSASDTATDPIASDALRDFEKKNIMHIRGNESTTLIAYRATDSINVTKSLTDVSKSDPYGCDDGDATSGKLCVGQACAMKLCN